MEFPPEVLEGIETLQLYFGDETDWVLFKKELLNHLKPTVRRNFSTRDPKTKQQSLNDFERALIKLWFDRTGILLTLPTP